MPLDRVLTYHSQTKHHFHVYARSLGYLDWATQPDPFRRYPGAPVIALEKLPPGTAPTEPLYEAAFVEGSIPPAPRNALTISQLFFDSLAISAWKSAGDSSWALRVNPSSGNLHPTEGYLVCGPVEGLCKTPMVCHYAPREHVLERRAEFPLETWRALTAGLPRETVLVGLTSIHWREAWKYGERAFRYCQHDVGHAIATVSVAAAGLGWRATLLDDVGTAELTALLGLPAGHPDGVEAEHADCILAVYPQGRTCATCGLPGDVLETFAELMWQGRPNRLSSAHVAWPIIEEVAESTVKPTTSRVYHNDAPESRLFDTAQDEPFDSAQDRSLGAENSSVSLRHIIHQRRSAVALDGRTGLSRDLFYKILRKTLARPGQFPFNSLPWRPHVHLALFVHRVQDLAPGLYVLVRDPAQKETLQTIMRDDISWEQPEGCPAGLGLYLLLAGDARNLSQQVSCHQAIASDGCFSLGMIARFEGSLLQFGPWFYPRLFWECGMVGQVLYLEAEAAGVRGTGIGCFFDDPVHNLLGLEGLRYQSLYHFTMGGSLDDPRLTTLPAYPAD